MKKILSLFLALLFTISICYCSSVAINAEAASVSDLTFELNWEEDGYCLYECSRDATGEIVVPEIYNGLPVKVIGAGVYEGFYGCKSITSVKLPKTIVEIVQGAFSECTSLKKIELPEGLTAIGSNAFSECVSLESVVIPSTTTWIGDWVFYGCKKLKSVNIPSSVGTIGKCSFGYYDNANGQREKIAGFIIYGKSGSAAEKYAVENGFKFEEPKVEIKLSTPKVTIKNTAKGIKVTWNAIENAENYVVYRRVYNASTKKWGGWSKLKTGVTATSCTDATVKLGTKYRYTVRAVNGSVMSAYKTTSTLTYNVTPTVKVANVSNGIKVTWTTAANATGYTVYSSSYNVTTKKWSAWKNRETTKATTKSWTDKKAKSGTKYKYTVRAINGNYKSTYKASVSILWLAQPRVTVKNTDNGIKVNWTQSAGAQNYIVYRSEYNTKTKKWSDWKKMISAKSDKKAWTDKSVKDGVTYKYTVRAVNGSTKSTYNASEKIKFNNVVVNSANVKNTFLPVFKYYYSLTETQHGMFIDGSKDYISLLPKSWYTKHGVASDGSAMLSVYKFKKYKTPAELKKVYKKYLSDEIIDEYNSRFSDQSLIVINGEMYAIRFGGRGSITYDVNSIEFRGKADGGYLVAIDMYNSGDCYCETEVFLIKSVNGALKIEKIYDVEEHHSGYYQSPDYLPLYLYDF